MAHQLYVVCEGTRTAVANYKDYFPTLNVSIASSYCEVAIDSSCKFDNCNINISCNDAILKIDKGNTFHSYYIGMDVGNKQIISIGSDNTFFWGGKIFIRDMSQIKIGNNNLFARNVSFFGSDMHTIFDITTGNVLNDTLSPDGCAIPLSIGDHNWIGDNAAITKKTKLCNDSIVGVGSIVTHRFEESNIIVAGNRARIIKRGVNWDRLPITLYKQSKGLS